LKWQIDHQVRARNDALRAERENELALREKNQRLAEIQQGIDEVNKQKAQQQSLLAQKESERQHELVILEMSFPRKGGQGAENLRKKNRHVHEYKEDL